MITENNLKYSSAIADGYIYSGKNLSPRPGTPLALLVASVSSGINETGSNEEIMALSNNVNIGAGAHGDIVVDCAKGAANILAKVIDVAKNVVNPKIREIIDAIDVAERENAERAAGGIPNIRILDVHALLQDDMFTALVNTYRESNINLPSRTEMYALVDLLEKQITPEIRAELVKSGSTGLDSKVAEFTATAVGSSLWNTWDVELNPDVMVYAFMMVSGILNGRSEALDGVIADTKDREMLTSLKASLGRRIFDNIKRLDAAIKSGGIIVPPTVVPSSRWNNEIWVLGQNYRKWIKDNGGSPEAVLGYAFDVGRVYDMAKDKALVISPAEFVAVYDRKQKHIDMMNRVENIDVAPRVVRDVITRQINSSEIEGKAELHAKLAEVLKTPYHGATEMIPYVRNAVCAVFTEGDDVKNLLANMDDVMATMETPDLEYAAFLATCRLVGSWLRTQIVVGG